MILRRFTEHVKAQNWTAVALDFVIVVVGVFIGIQVANWNEAGADRKREQEYYVQILKDLRSDVAMARLVAHDARTFDEHGDYLASALEDPDFAMEDPDYFVLSVARAGYTRFPVINRHTIGELESIGGLTLLVDRDVKNAILDYYGAASNTAQWNELLRAEQLIYKNAHLGLLSRETERQIAEKVATFDRDFRTWEEEKKRIGPAGFGVSKEEAQQILARARDKENFMGALSLMEVVHSRLELRAALIEEEAQALIGVIEAHVGETADDETDEILETP